MSHYGDIKHTSGTHIILWMIKMLGGWDRGGVATLNVAQQQTERERGDRRMEKEWEVGRDRERENGRETKLPMPDGINLTISCIEHKFQ